MEKYVNYSSTVIRFISSFDIAPNNYMVYNTLDREADFVSKYYTPEFRVSELASFVLKDIQRGVIRPVKEDIREGSFLHIIQKSTMRENNNRAYQISKVILLEIFSIMYVVDNKPRYAKYLSESDIRQARTNIKYLLDIIGTTGKYTELKEHLHEFDIALGYIQGQVPKIKEDALNGTI